MLFLAIVSICFFALVPSAVYDFFLERKTDRLVTTAEELTNYPEVYFCDFSEEEATAYTRDILYSLSENQEIEIWLVNEEGRILLDCRRDYALAESTMIPDFSSIASQQSYWITGDFFDMFTQPVLSVISPVKATPHTTAYVLVHYPLYHVVNEENAMMETCKLILIIFLLSSLLFPIAFYWIYYRPLQHTLKISNEYASGNLKTLTPSVGNDEFALLKTNLNYMAGELKQSEENQRKFISNISHDFRSPLTSIKGYAEAILDGTIPKESQDKYLEIILTETERLTNLTQNILTTNSLKEGSTFLERSVFDINTVLQSSAAAMEIQCRKKDLQILVDLPFYPQNVNADKTKIQQVIYNLLDNAIKFSDPHSTIRISTAEKRKYIFVSIKDNGEGIPADQIPKIWNRFYKSDTSRGKDKKGTGLGLSIVREIIRAHGQNINVVSTKGVGSEFIFTLDKAE